MATIGIVTTIFPRPTLDEVLDAVVSHGIKKVQFDLRSAGAREALGPIDRQMSSSIRGAMSSHGLSMAALEGTFNMIDPDVDKRRDGLNRLCWLIEACPILETDVITLCTGTRDPVDMWRYHEDNATPSAWADLVGAMREAVACAEHYHVTLAFEPEVDNVVDSAIRGRRLLDEVASPNLKVVMDAANLFHAGELSKMHNVLDEAFATIGGEIALAHAKDLDHDGEAGGVAAGRGRLDYEWYLRLLRDRGYNGAVILHSLPEDDVDRAIEFVASAAPRSFWD